MGYAWIDELQQAIDQEGVEQVLYTLGVSDVWTSYESCLCQINLDGVEEGDEFFADITAQGMLSDIRYQAFIIYIDGGSPYIVDLTPWIVNIGDDVISIEFSIGSVYHLLLAECAFLITSEDPSEITALQTIRTTPAGAVLTFDFPTPSTKLATPTGLNADNITSDSARTNWQAVENASNYKVQYKAAGDTVWTETFTD